MALAWLSLAFFTGIGLAALTPFAAVYGYAASILALGLAIAAISGAARLSQAAHQLAAHPGLARVQPARLSAFVSASAQSLATPYLPAFACLCLAAAGLGAGRYQASWPALDAPGFITAHANPNQVVFVSGWIAEDPERRDGYTQIVVEAESIRSNASFFHTPVRGRLLAWVRTSPTLEYGQRVVLKGGLENVPSFTEFNYPAALARREIYAYMSFPDVGRLEGKSGGRWLAAILRLRGQVTDMIYRLFPDPEASLLAGILVGVETGISPQVQWAFEQTGTGHIIAISGFNIAIVAGVSGWLFTRGQRRGPGLLAAALAVAGYTLLAGASPSVVRAAIMGIFGLLAAVLRLRTLALNGLLITAAGMAFLSPKIIGDVSFQLSFMATLGLVLYAQPLTELVEKAAARFSPQGISRTTTRLISEYLLMTLAAQLTVLPVVFYHFRRFSLVSFLANPLILPAQPVVMALGGTAVLTGMVWNGLGQILAWLAWVPLAYTVRVVESLANWPGASFSLNSLPLTAVIGFYLALFGLTFAWPRLEGLRQAFNPKRWFSSPVFIGAALLLVVFAWRMAWSAPDGRMHLTFLDTGGGDAVLIQTPGGRFVLVNGGPSGVLLSDALGRLLPPQRRQLDWLLVATPQQESTAGLPAVLARFPPGQVLWSGRALASRPARELGSALQAAQIPITEAQAGQSLDLGDGAALRVLAAGPEGAILRVEWGNFQALLPVGLSVETLKTLQNDPALTEVDVLLLAGGGSGPLNPPEWLAALNPQLCIASVGAANPGGLPHPETLTALNGRTLLRSDLNGQVVVSTDGQNMWVESEK